MNKEQNKSLQIVIDDGTREIPVKNQFGKLICKIHIRPADYSIMDRYNDFTKDFEEIVKPLEEIGITNTGEAEVEEGWKVIKSVEAEIIRRFNSLFDMDDAEKLFKTRNAFSSIQGRFYCEIVLEALGEVILNAINEESEKTKAKVEKYLS